MSQQSEKVKEFYANDIIYRFDKNKKIVFGVVVNTYENSQDDDDDAGALQKGQISVSWENAVEEQVWRQSKVRLVNRSIIPGDIVRRLEEGKETQRGYCKDVKQSTTVHIVGTDKVVEHVSSERLHNVRPLDIDDVVCCGSKVGHVDGIDQLITMQSKDGSIVELLTSINRVIDDYWLWKRSKFTLEIYYAGQEVIGVPSKFKEPKWIKKTKDMRKNIHKRQRFTIQKVVDCVIDVSMYNDSGHMDLSEFTQPNIKTLKVLEHPSDNSLELGERRILKLTSRDVLLKKKEWYKKLSILHRPEVPKIRHIVSCSSKINSRVPRIRSSSLLYPVSPLAIDQSPPVFPDDPEDEDWWTEEGEDSEEEITEGVSESSSKEPSIIEVKKHYPPRANELSAGHSLPVEIIYVESKVTVVWQDGTEEKDIPSTQLYYSISLDDHEFFPGEWVVKDNGSKEKCLVSSQYGVVQLVDYLERTATVKWFSYSSEDKQAHCVSVEEVSVYDLKKHAKFVFRPGSIVRAISAEEERVGKIVDSCIEGFVIVQWLSKIQEKCWPQDIELMPDPDLGYAESEGSTDDEKVSWETESIESFAGSDLTDETVLQNMAGRLDFVRSRIVFLKEAFKNRIITNDSFTILKDLLLIYENYSYLDKLLGTSFFSLKSKHFQALLLQAKEKAKAQNIELRGRIFSNDSNWTVTKTKAAEQENIKKMIKLENKVNAEIENKESPSTPSLPDISQSSDTISESNLCVELLSTLKIRMDLSYAEIISRIGDNQTFSVCTKATETIITPPNCTPLPSVPTTPDDSFSILSPLKPKKPQTLLPTIPSGEEIPASEWYSMVDEAPENHHFYTSKFEPGDSQKFLKTVMKEYKLLQDSLPPNVWVRSYNERIDLLSVMIRGPDKTPYEDGLFLFDIKLSNDYPRSPPLVHYISYSSERLNPNLYVEGKVCVSLLGTWMGKGTEVWGPNSTLLQLIVSIQGLILVSEPYYNEAGYDKQTETQQGYENSRTYNELVILKLVQSMTLLLENPPEVFKKEILSHFERNAEKWCKRLMSFCDNSVKPDFPLLPVSKGLKLSLITALEQLQQVLIKPTDQ
ncbi:unnamed protein product [Ceutorhynchus assimilis]|uniref:UBC core domain-containing protein n=1 Tax=Ceutorhynchus assimilis TaxID=467358 RepID=A0A9N9MPC4_9CUCU|nr:unnamed protein product [Ceutorhynchus assimilis]